MRIIFFGTPHFVIPVLEVLQKQYDVVGVVTTPDVVAGRKKVLTPSPIKAFSLQHNLPVFTLEEMENGKWKMENSPPDLFVVAAYGHLVPENILSIPAYGSLNIHSSLLPKYRGPSPIQSAILNGDRVSGITIIKMDEKLDHGPILAQKEMQLSDTDTFESLHVRMFAEAASMLPQVINQYVKREIVSQDQDHSKATYCEHITKQDGYFDIDNPPSSEKLDRMIRAYYPWPTAWTRIRIKNQEVRIMKLLPEKKVQIEGGKIMTIKDFLNGYPEVKATMGKLFYSLNS